MKSSLDVTIESGNFKLAFNFHKILYSTHLYIALEDFISTVVFFLAFPKYFM